jgi:large subunit ribosomal protein L34
MSFTYNPKKKKRAKTHGFLKRSQTKKGAQVIQRRRAKGRKKVVSLTNDSLFLRKTMVDFYMTCCQRNID